MSALNFYPAVTNVKPLTRIRRQRVAPRDGELQVEAGQQVTATQVLLRYAGESAYRIIDAAAALEVSPTALNDFLLVHEGAPVDKGTPLLRKPARYGRGRQLLSPVAGTLHRVINGRLLLRLAPTPQMLRAIIPGYVINLVRGRGAVIETYGSLVQGLWGTGKDGNGRLALAGDAPDVVLSKAQITPDMRNRILVAGSVADLETLQLAVEMGVRGLVVGGLPARLMAGAARLGMPLLATDGIGGKRMAAPIFELLAQSVGRDAALLGEMDAAAGLRPELIIPLPADRDMDTPAGANVPIAVGKQVRLLRAPYAGATGEVIAIHARAQELPTGARVPTAEVKLAASGETCLVPYANLDLIE
jgi:hypothetical protein